MKPGELMQQETESTRRVRLKVFYYLIQLFGEGGFKLTSDQHFRISRGPCTVEVNVNPWRHNESIVHFVGKVETAVELNWLLLRQLLDMNGQKLRFGSFGINEDGGIVVSHFALGSTLDKNELRYAIQSIAVLADQYGENISKTHGGESPGTGTIDKEYTMDGWEEIFEYDCEL